LLDSVDIRGSLPASLALLGRCVRYRQEDITAFIARHTRRSTGKGLA